MSAHFNPVLTIIFLHILQFSLRLPFIKHHYPLTFLLVSDRFVALTGLDSVEKLNGAIG